jgi:hypothetical protein
MNSAVVWAKGTECQTEGQAPRQRGYVHPTAAADINYRDAMALL